MKYTKKQTKTENKIVLIYSNRKLKIKALCAFDYYDILYSISIASEKSIFTNI